MKPSSGQNNLPKAGNCRRERSFPITDCNYQAFSLERHYGGWSADPASSFLNISREYFRYEARRNFLAEAAFFLALVGVLAATFITGAIAIINFLNRPEG